MTVKQLRKKLKRYGKDVIAHPYSSDEYIIYSIAELLALQETSPLATALDLESADYWDEEAGGLESFWTLFVLQLSHSQQLERPAVGYY
tara:strand:- start:1 stop:267 length:267 start_codon:yes stop_codon:yes gene_type:complete